MTDEQTEIADLAAKLLSGILAGSLTKQGFDVGSVRPHHIQAAVNIALALRAEVQQRVP